MSKQRIVIKGVIQQIVHKELKTVDNHLEEIANIFRKANIEESDAMQFVNTMLTSKLFGG